MEMSELIPERRYDLYSLNTTQAIYKSGTCLNFENEFIPVLYLKEGERFLVEDNIISLMYSKVIRKPQTMNGIGRISAVCSCLASPIWNSWFKYTPQPDWGTYVVTNNSVFYYDTNPLVSPKILMTLCFRANRYGDVLANPLKTDFTLLIDKSFMTNDNHFKIYRNVKRTYIDVLDAEIGIMYTPDIDSLCFKEYQISPQRFRTILEMEAYGDRVSEMIKPYI